MVVGEKMTCAWPQIADMLITTGWAYGVPTREIAAAVSIATGREVTRCAVIGRADRIGMTVHPLCDNIPSVKHRPHPAAPAAAMAAR
jgi:Na+-transporting NADH:ubiquinone oxidoreductase subunit NqrD